MPGQKHLAPLLSPLVGAFLSATVALFLSEIPSILSFFLLLSTYPAEGIQVAELVAR